MKGIHTGSFHLSIPLLPSSHRETPVIDPRNNVVEEGIACSSWKGTLSRFISKKKKKLALDETRWLFSASNPLQFDCLFFLLISFCCLHMNCCTESDLWLSQLCVKRNPCLVIIIVLTKFSFFFSCSSSFLSSKQIMVRGVISNRSPVTSTFKHWKMDLWPSRKSARKIEHHICVKQAMALELTCPW